MRAFGTQKLDSDGVCSVCYYDLRDSVAAYIKISNDTEWTVQYCSGAYFSMVSHRYYIVLLLLIMYSQLQLNAGAPDKGASEIYCRISSGSVSVNISSALYSALSSFGTIIQFVVLDWSDSPAFSFTFGNSQEASEVVEILDGQYLEARVPPLQLFFLLINPSGSVLI